MISACIAGVVLAILGRLVRLDFRWYDEDDD